MDERFTGLPSALKANARWARLGGALEGVPAMLVHPRAAAVENGVRDDNVPVVLWMHGRTVEKETDPGRYLRWMRAGLGVCAVDLPGHGERFDETLQQPERTLDVVRQMVEEIDGLIAVLKRTPGFDGERVAIGGMSAGGMATLAWLARAQSAERERVLCAAVEATTGSWKHQAQRDMFRGKSEAEMSELNPAAHLDAWRELPLQAIHSEADEWVAWEGQRTFLETLRERYRDPSLIEVVTYERTGAPAEHIGFGKVAADAKDRQRDFLVKHLLQSGRPLE